MALTVNTNRASVVAQRNLARSATALERNIERLSSGYRINSARDDSAGLSIATRLDTQVRGLGQAVRNTNDGISLAQTAEAALNDVTSGLIRIRELAVQSANDTNDEDDREALQGEVGSIIDEIGRIAEETTFNGVRPLAGRGQQTFIHIGSGARETVGLSSVDARKSHLGRYVRVEGNAVLSTGALSAGGVVVNGTSIRGTVAADDSVSFAENAASAIALARALNASEPFTRVTAFAAPTVFTGAGSVAAGTLNDLDYLVVNGTQITGFDVQDNDADEALRDAINAVADDTGVVASLTETFELNLRAEDGRNIILELSTDAAATATGLRAGAGTSSGGGSIVLESDRPVQLVFADPDAANHLGLNGGLPGTLTLGIDGDNALTTIDVSTREGAERAINLADSALRHVSRFRSAFGAATNRLESTVENLASQGEYLSAARSRIIDADFAAETAALARNSFLKDAGLAVLAQANVSTSAALSLLS